MIRSFRRTAKLAALLAATAVVLTGAARVGVGRYLTSARGKAMVADRIGSALGMPVEVSDVHVGGGDASFRFRVMDPADPKAEVLNVRSASADVTVADLMSGRVAPSALTLNGAALTLRVDADGQVVTPLPGLPGAGGAFPAVAIAGGRMAINQDGRPAFAVTGVSLTLEPSGQAIILTGSIADPAWGNWTIRGEVLRDSRSGWVEFASADASLDPELLATVPFVPPDLFDEVKAVGRAAVTVRLTVGIDRTVQPVVDIRPTRTLFGIPLGRTIRLVPASDRFRIAPLP